MSTLIAVLDKGYIQKIHTWGGDKSIIEAARMSTDGGFRGWGGEVCPSCVIEKKLKAHLYEPDCKICKGTGYTIGDEKLLRYLWTHKHTTPFEMAGMTIEVKAPIFVFREWHRHRTQSYNEFSARYSELPDEFYIPSITRLQNSRQDMINKQGSGSGFNEIEAENRQHEIEQALGYARRAYVDLLAMGVAKEVARLVIPVSQYSKMRASANLWNWLRFLKLRMATNAQWEIRQYALQLFNMMCEEFPRTMELFKEEISNA